MSEQIPPPFLSTLAHHAADPFRLLVESVVEYAIFMLDPAGRVVSWNPGAERVYACPGSQIIGKSFSRFYTASDQAAGKPEEALRLALETNSYEQTSLRVRHDGSQFWAVVTVSNLKDYFGNHAGFSVVTRDISEQRAAEEAIRTERDISDAILSSLPGVYYMYDETGRFLRWNKRFEEVTEYTAEEIRQLHPLDSFEGEDKKRLQERIGNVFVNGRDEIEATFVSKSGRRTPYYFNGVRAEFNGKPCLLGMGIDITYRVRAEQELRTKDDRLQQAAKAANVGLWDWDIHTNQVYYSAEWKRQIGYEEHEIGNDLNEWQVRVHPDDLEAALQGMRNYIADPTQRYEIEFRLKHRNGSYRLILSQGSLLFDEQQKPIRMLGSHVDVTEKKRLEQKLQQAQKMEAIGLLAGGVAHDFNNLLTVINGCSELLLDQMDEQHPMQQLLLEIYQAGERAAGLTRQLLAFSRKQVLEPKILNLNQVVQETEKLLRRMVGEDIDFSVSLQPNIGLIKVDPGQVEQVLINLVVNARDAMPTFGQLTIETQQVSLDSSYCRGLANVPPGDYVLLAVSDTGCGMDAETQAKIFEPFFTTKEIGKGTGLGLATVHGIVKQSQGHIAVYSELGQGTTFKIYFPQVETPANHQASQSSKLMPSGTETVLLVEDEEAVRTLGKLILQKCGYHVLEDPNGKEALQMAAAFTGPIHLLLSDVVMPLLGGRELAQKMIQLLPQIKILFLSGYTDDAIIRHGVLSSEVAFLQKPFTPTALAQKVRHILDSTPTEKASCLSHPSAP